MDYLLKTEPSEYSFVDLQRDAVTVWDGVANPVALKHLREMKPGARLVIYETADRKSAVGTASVVSVDVSDPKNPAVKIKAGKALANPVSLAQIKANKLSSDSPRAPRQAFGGFVDGRPIQSADWRLMRAWIVRRIA